MVFDRNWRWIFPVAAGILALAAYWLTVDSGASYWDCPEYLITALKLEVGHPPGNPGWSLIHRVVSSLFAGEHAQTLAVNMMSGVFTALAAMLLCTVSMTLMRLVWSPARDTRRRRFSIAVSSLAGSLCFAWSDSAWYSAVEAEVYAMSLFLSALTVWMALKWAFALSATARARWLVAVFYVIGFSLGVHQLNLLALPAIAMIMAAGIRSRCRRVWRRRSIAFLVGCVGVAVILKGIMPGAVAAAEAADVWAVNCLHMPYWSGAAMFWIAAFLAVVVVAVLVTRRHLWAGTAFWSLAAVMAGCSVYILIPIRAWANPPVNEGDPSTPPRFADYLDRRQYGGAPLFYGRTPQSRIMRVERVSVGADGDTVYDYTWNAMKVRGKDMRSVTAGAHIPVRSRFLTEEDVELNRRLASDTLPGYAVVGFRTEPVYTPELNMLLPRIHSSAADDLPAYADWTGMDSANMVRVRISEAVDSLGNYVPMRGADGKARESYASRPTYLQSLAYLLGYQTGYMYLRYLMWNFSGRQNDVPATGEIDHGNFITGISPVDDLMLGDQSALPDDIGKANAGRNVYWMVPFILGLAGIIWLFGGKGAGLSTPAMRSVAWFTLALFVMTGVAIVVYLNQTPGEPRERDYTFLGSYWTFAVWIAFGMLWVLCKCSGRLARTAAALLVCSVPAWMLAENWRDHDRSGRSATLDYASNLLESLDKDAILFVDGDNYIFPLWYAQEVMGVRRDVSVVCNSFLVCDWYLPQLMVEGDDRPSVAMTAKEGDVAMGNYNLIRLSGADTDTVAAVEALRELYADQSPTPAFRHRWLRMGKWENPWVFDLLSIPGKRANSIAGLREVAAIDIIATNAASRYPRPVYWHQNLGRNKYTGFYPFTRQALFTRRLMPSASDSLILTDESLNALPRLKWGGLDGMPYPGPDVVSHAELQRASLIRLAEAVAADRPDLALHVARMAMVRFPSRAVPYGIRSHGDSVYFEARNLASVLIGCGDAVGDSAAVAEGISILREDSLRSAAYRRYRHAIPASRRGAISPASNNRSISTRQAR